MAQKLKTYQTSMGFFDLAIAAPSMKAAAEAWGADPDIFRRGHAEQTDDSAIVEATLAAPGIVLRRPVGSNGKFAKHAELPKAPKSRKTAIAHKAKKREETRLKKVQEKAEAAFARAKKRHDDVLRLLEQQRAEIAQAEDTENEQWEEEKRVYHDALATKVQATDR